MQIDTTPPDQFEIAPLVRIIWQNKKLILRGTLSITFCVILISLLLPTTYVSKGFLTAEMTTTSYNKEYPAFTDSQRFIKFLESRKSFSKKAVNEIQHLFSRPEQMGSMLHVVYESEAAHPLPSAPPPPNVIGLWITAESSTKDGAQQLVSAIGDYITNHLLYTSLYDYIWLNYAKATNDRETLTNNALNNDFQITLMRNKISDLSRVRKEYPSAPLTLMVPISISGNSITARSQDYVSPTIAVVKLEADIINLKYETLRLNHDLAINEIKLGFLSKAKNILDNANIFSATELLDQLAALKETYFKDVNLPKNPLQKQVLNEISNDLGSITQEHFQSTHRAHFTAGPNLPDHRTWPNRSAIVLFSALASILFFSFLSLLIQWLSEIDLSPIDASPIKHL